MKMFYEGLIGISLVLKNIYYNCTIGNGQVNESKLNSFWQTSDGWEELCQQASWNVNIFVEISMTGINTE